MTSKERHEARYQRRKAARETKRRSYLDLYDNFERVTNTSALIKAHFDSRRGVLWKYAPALYDSNYIKYSVKSAQRLSSGKDVRQGYHSFKIIERGKLREIHSLHYAERVIRRAVCINCLVPIMSHNLVWDNGACLKGKGGSFTERRLAAHLHDYFRKYHDNNGYVITVDFSKYFANIDHNKLFGNINRYVKDQKLSAIIKGFVKGGDTTSGTPGKGLYIGPEDSQILAVSYPNVIDHAIKDQWRIRWYGRYNDDSYIICRTKQEAKQTLSKLLALYDEWGIIPNRKKTQIVKLSRGFAFLKIHWALTSSGRVIRRPGHESTVRERRKLKTFKRFYDAGEMTLHDICQSYMSWRGHIRYYKNSGRTVFNMDRLFLKLFNTKPWRRKNGRKLGSRK